MKKVIIVAAFVILAVLHQDFWNWDNSSLVLGFMPVGLFYHALYSIVAATFWALVVKFAWPTKLEEWADGGDADSSLLLFRFFHPFDVRDVINLTVSSPS